MTRTPTPNIDAVHALTKQLARAIASGATVSLAGSVVGSPELAPLA